MTRLLVSDTSVLIDLERGGLIETAFALPYELAVPDLLYKQELRQNGGPALQQLGLVVAELSSEQVRLAQDLQRTAPKLSLPDTFALILAQSGPRALLTGDQGLRTLAESRAVVCHGVLWLLDQMVEHGAATTAAMYHALTSISKHQRSRLPTGEVKARRMRWAEAAGLSCEG